MTLYDFVQLNETEKADLVWDGTFLSLKEERDCTIVLYKISDFFCEVYFDKIKNAIIRLKPFRAKEMLQEFFAYQMN